PPPNPTYILCPVEPVLRTVNQEEPLTLAWKRRIKHCSGIRKGILTMPRTLVIDDSVLEVMPDIKSDSTNSFTNATEQKV
ncbi:hypothetical protein, partial [Gordonia alkanivorans]|uniref:hypothetical protein n=1 Tax=Gordonia alkanivorans TaxID=84096 RepID=UPI00244AB655